MTNQSREGVREGHFVNEEKGFTCPRCGVYYPKAFYGKKYNNRWEVNRYMFANKCCANYYLIDGTNVTHEVERNMRTI